MDQRKVLSEPWLLDTRNDGLFLWKRVPTIHIGGHFVNPVLKVDRDFRALWSKDTQKCTCRVKTTPKVIKGF